MQSVKTKDTGPELTVRQILSSLGYRYRLYVKKLPGRPDIVFPSKRKAIFVHGCFWHGHGCCKGRAPKSRQEYWEPKLKANKERDEAQVLALQALGWTVLTVWQCESRDRDALRKQLIGFVDASAKVKRCAIG